MTKCGKSSLPECEYFATNGCVSPFNCPYKVENESVTTATSTPCNLYPLETDKDKEISRLTAENQRLREEVAEQKSIAEHEHATQMEWFSIAGDYKAENVELRKRLNRSVELPFENLDKVFILAGEDTKTKQFIPDRIVEGTIVGFGYDVYEWANGNYKFNYHVLVGEDNYIFALEQFNKTLFKTRKAAEARLKELKEEI